MLDGFSEGASRQEKSMILEQGPVGKSSMGCSLGARRKTGLDSGVLVDVVASWLLHRIARVKINT